MSHPASGAGGPLFTDEQIAMLICIFAGVALLGSVEVWMPHVTHWLAARGALVAGEHAWIALPVKDGAPAVGLGWRHVVSLILTLTGSVLVGMWVTDRHHAGQGGRGGAR